MGAPVLCLCSWGASRWVEGHELLPEACPVSLLQCKMEFHACSTGKSLTTLCDGPCPCLPEPEPPKHKAEKNGEWGPQETPGRREGWREGLAWLSCAQMPGTWHTSEPGWAEGLTWQVLQLVEGLPSATIKKQKES